MNNQNSNNRRSLWLSILQWLLIPTLCVVFFTLISVQTPVQQEDVPFSTLIENAQAHNVKKIYFSNTLPYTLRFTLKNSRRLFVTKTPANLSLIQYLQEKNVNINEIDSEEQAPMSLNTLFSGLLTLLSVLLQLLNVLGPIALTVILFRNFQKRDNQFEVGKAYKLETTSPVTFKDVAGATNAKDEIAEVVDFLTKPQAFIQMGATLPKGVILCGPPGVGKTLLARAVAGEAQVPFLYVSGSEFSSSIMSVGVSRIKSLFQSARELEQNMIIFIDEIDSIGTKRLMARDSGSIDTNQTLNQLLDEMDGFNKNRPHHIIVIAATNLIEVLDPALTRAGRFDRKIYMGLPGKKDRLAIMNLYAAKVKLAADVCLEDFAALTSSFSGADLALLINEAAICSVRNNHQCISHHDLTEVYQRQVLGGRLNKSISLSDKGKEETAYHEAGHALIAYLTKHDVYILSIEPRANSLGVTFVIPEDDNSYVQSKTHCQDDIKISLAGRAAEEIIYGKEHINSGAHADIVSATEMARTMVTKYGFSEELGFVNYGAKQAYNDQGHSEFSQAAIDQEIKKIIQQAYADTKELLQNHLELLHRLAKSVLQAGTLTKEEILRVLTETTLPVLAEPVLPVLTETTLPVLAEPVLPVLAEPVLPGSTETIMNEDISCN